MLDEGKEVQREIENWQVQSTIVPTVAHCHILTDEYQFFTYVPLLLHSSLVQIIAFNVYSVPIHVHEHV